MNYTELLKTGVPAGGYLFYGAEDYLKQHTLGQVRDALFPDGVDEFNRYLFTAETYDPGSLAQAILSPAMMAEKKLVEVSLPDGDGMKEKERTALTDALAYLHDTDDTVLVLSFPADTLDPGTPKRPSAFFRALTKWLTPVEFPRQPDARLLRWMERHLADYGVRLPPAVGQLILERCGRSMMRLSGELAKAGAYAAEHGMPQLTPEVVLSVTTPTEEDDAFRLANCILAGDKPGAYACLDIKIRRREDPILLLSQITRVFLDLSAAAVFLEEGRDKRDFAAAMKMHEYKAALYWKAAEAAPPLYFEDALEKCLRTDTALKSTPLGYQLLERLLGTL